MKIYLAPLLLLLCGGLLDGPAALPASYASPQATVSAYWFRMLERHHAAALDCFLDNDSSDVGNMLGLPDLVELRCRDFSVVHRSSGTVDVTYKVEYRVAMGDSLARFGTGDRLQLTSSGWKIARPLLDGSGHP